jgi:TonB family protein
MKLHLTVILTLFLSFSLFAQSASQASEGTGAVEEILKLNSQVVKLYSEKRFDEALVIAKKIWDIAAANNLISDGRVLPAIRNLGELHLAKGKESEAISVFQIVSDQYEKMGDKGRTELEKVMSRLAAAYISKKDFKNAESQYLKLKNLTETAYGEKSRQSANAYLQLANLYNLQKKGKEAEEFYLKAILINDAVLSKKEQETRQDVDTYKCWVFHREYQRNALKGAMDLFKDLDKKRGIQEDNNKSQGVINGKALRLIQPVYPQSAKAKRASGFAVVRVDIDEQGNVTNAKTFCGYLDFVKEVEEAALKSKFTPTLVKGVPVKVTGEIVYNFVAQ